MFSVACGTIWRIKLNKTNKKGANKKSEIRVTFLVQTGFLTSQ